MPVWLGMLRGRSRSTFLELGGTTMNIEMAKTCQAMNEAVAIFL